MAMNIQRKTSNLANIVQYDASGNVTLPASLTVANFVRTGGLSTQFLMADGSVSTNPGWITGFTETDPTVPSHVKSISTTNISNWNTAFNWGNHAAVGYLTSFTETDPTVPSHVKAITTIQVSNWDAAFSWGNHALAGYLLASTAASTYVALGGSYANPSWITSLAWSKITGAPAFLTSYTETDPFRVISVAVSGTTTKTITITRADNSTVTTTWTDIDSDTNTFVTSASFSGGTLTLTRNDAGTVSVSLDGRYSLTTHTHDDRYYTETEINNFFSGATAITGYNKSNWDTAFGWGNHASAGYLTTSSAASTYVALGGSYANPSWITSLAWSKITGAPAFLTSYTETDTLASVTGRGASTSTPIVLQGNLANWNATTPGTSVGGLHLGAASSTANVGAAITFGARDTASGLNAQAGIFVVSGGGFGTEMYIATTDSYANGARTAISISNIGLVNFVRTRPTALGNVILDAGNYNSYSPTLTGGNASGTWSINVTGNAGSASSVAWTNVSGRPTALSSFSNDVGYITNGGRAYPRRADGTGMDFYWSGQSGQPTWLWGSNNGVDMYVWNPSNFSVNYANSAGSISGQANSATITASTGVNGNHIVQRDGNGYIYANHINFNTSESENPTINSFITSNGDGWSRKSTLHHVKNQIRGVADGTWSISVTGSSRLFPTNYIGGVQSNPQVYFNSSTGLNVAMTGHWSVWSDTLWINGYSGGDVPRMCALHFMRNTEPRMGISNQPFDSSSYGTVFEVLSSYNFSWWAINRSGDTVSNVIYYLSNRNTDSSNAPLQAYSSNGSGAIMGFHRGGAYAINMGLDSDNVFRIGGWSAAANRFQMDMSGNLTMSGDVTAYSDARLKENVVTVDSALDKVVKLRGVYYNRTDSDDKRRKVGVIAQEIQRVLPEVVNQDNSGILNVSYGNIVGVLIEAIKEQQTQIEDLKQLVESLKN